MARKAMKIATVQDGDGCATGPCRASLMTHTNTSRAQDSPWHAHLALRCFFLCFLASASSSAASSPASSGALGPLQRAWRAWSHR